MLKNAFYICMATLLSVVSFGTNVYAKPALIYAQTYSHKFITPIYRDTSRFTRGNWTNIGCQRADYVDGRYVMEVERHKGPFDKLRLKISSVDFHVVGLKVVFYNGQRASLIIRSEDSYPGRGVVLDLPGRKRYIKKIIMKYGSRSSSYRPIVVCIDGHEVAEGGYNEPRPYEPNYGGNSGSGGSDDYDTGSSDDGYGAGNDYGSGSSIDQAGWELIACITAKHRTRSRYFRVGRSKGRFKAMRLIVGKHGVRLKSLSVTFGNGRKKIIPGRYIKRNSAGQTIRFGRKRFVEVVDLRVKTNGLFRHSKVCLQGMKSGGGYQEQNDTPRQSKWRTLGCKALQRHNPRSKFITIGRREGRFKELRLTASGSTVGLTNVGVVYGNGRDHVLLSSRTQIRRGAATRHFHLKNGRRYLKEVEIVAYKKGRNSRAATVCVQGR